MTRQVDFGDFTIEIDGANGTDYDQQKAEETLLVIAESCKFHGISTDIPAGSHQLSGGKINLYIDPNYAESATTTITWTGTPDGNARATNVEIRINPSRMKDAFYYSQEKGVWISLYGPGGLGNEIHNAIGAVNPNVDIPGGPGSGPNTVFGYPYGASENPDGSDPAAWQQNAGPLETFSAVGQDRAEKLYGNDYAREVEYLPGFGDTYAKDLNELSTYSPMNTIQSLGRTWTPPETGLASASWA